MRAFGFLLHDDRPEAATLGAELARWLLDRGHEVRLDRSDAARVGMSDVGFALSELAIGLDLLIGIGGDGTVLAAASLGADHGVPVLGVNVGRLGYLTMVEPAAARAAIKRFLSGAFEIEERMRIAAAIERADGQEPLDVALNEVLLERAELGHTVRIEVQLDGEAFTPYVADGVIVATPTGSTAYALSARGPIVDPRHRAQILVPVSPHMLFDRALVLTPETSVRLVVAGGRAGHVSIDGRSGGVVEVGEAIRCWVDPRPARLVRYGTSTFHGVLRRKFHLADR
ncbi:MAG: NAD(+)/NADH kinase [Microthrixaceae bacterium]